MNTQLGTEMNPGRTGAKRQSWRDGNPREVLSRLINKNKNADKDEIMAECWIVIEKNPNHIRTIFEYWFANNYRSFVIAPSAQTCKERDKAIKEKIETVKVQAGVELQRKIEERAFVFVMETILPNGKSLGDCTFSEVRKMGGTLSKFAKYGAPNELIKKKLSPSQLAAIQANL